MTEIIKFISELLKIKDPDTVAIAGSAVLLCAVFFLFTHSVKVFTKSEFERSFLRKDQQFFQKFYKILYAFMMFNILCFVWAWFMSANFDYNNLPYVLDKLFVIVIFYFILSFVLILIGSIVKVIQKKWLHMKPGKRAFLIYNSIMNLSLAGFYLIYLLALFIYFDTRNKNASYFTLLGEISIFIIISFLLLFFFGRFVTEFFELVENRFTSIIMNEKACGPLHVLYGIDAKNIVLGDSTTEGKSKKLYLYNLEKKEAIEFEVKLIEPDKRETVTGETGFSPRKKRHS